MSERALSGVGALLSCVLLACSEDPGSPGATVAATPGLESRWRTEGPSWDGRLATRVLAAGELGTCENPLIVSTPFDDLRCPAGDSPQYFRLGNAGDSAGHGDIVDRWWVTCEREGWGTVLCFDEYHGPADATDEVPAVFMSSTRPASQAVSCGPRASASPPGLGR
jgi:hypothetical protein